MEGNAALLSDIRSEIDRVRSELQQSQSMFQGFPRDMSDEDIGSALLDAFLNDLPFDRFTFGRLPIKVAFLNAAFRTSDDEIISEAFAQVQLTLNDVAFEELLNSNAKFRDKYKALRCARTNDESAAGVLSAEQRDSPSELMRAVLSDAARRANPKDEKDKHAGYEEIDFKWNLLISGLRDLRRLQHVGSLIGSVGMGGHRLNGIPAVQGALYAKSLNAPPSVINDFVRAVSKDERQELIAHGIIAA